MASETLNCLLTWVKGFDFVEQDLEPEFLSDGIIIAKILVSTSPSAFTQAWLSRIKTEASSNLSNKIFNLNLIVDGISRFFESVIGQPLAIYQLPNVTSIAETNDTGELYRLLQLVICCAVNGESKEKYIQEILSMEQAVQQAVMETVQEVMNEKSSRSDETSLMSIKYDRDDELARKCHDLECKLARLEAEKCTVDSELEEALQRISLLGANEAGCGGVGVLEPGSAGAALQVRQLQDKLLTLQEELFQSEADAQEVKIQLVEARRTIEELRKTCDSLTRQADDAAHFKDELDITREELAEANRRASTVDQLKKRAEEAIALRIRCAKLESDNSAYVERLGELEQENRLNSSLRVHAEVTRNQSAEANSRASELELRTLKMEDDLKKARADLQTTLREKDTLFAELKGLRDLCERASGLSQPSETGECLISLRPSLNAPPKPIATEGHTESKPHEVYEVEQRYRGYLAKALELIRLLDRRVVEAENAAVADNPPDAPDSRLTRLQALLAEKETVIEQLERHHEQARRQHDLEERIILTAWYHLGMRVNRANAETCLLKECGGESQPTTHCQSFLTQQRRVHLRSSPPRSLKPPPSAAANVQF